VKHVLSRLLNLVSLLHCLHGDYQGLWDILYCLISYSLFHPSRLPKSLNYSWSHRILFCAREEGPGSPLWFFIVATCPAINLCFCMTRPLSNFMVSFF
jgi:hypothetical protein